MAQDIYLSPRNILSYMSDLEAKLPKRRFVEYNPSEIPKIEGNSELNTAAQMMMKFVGLENYTPQCSFSETSDGVGGYTYAARTDNLLPITVSKEYIGNRAAILAILAHEICHKVIYVNGIRYNAPFEMMNEVFTDICTIYVGFGNLILNGYITSNNKHTSYLGYLQFDVYKDVNNIMQQVLNSRKVNELKERDLFLEDAFSMWHSNADKYRLFMDSFVDIQDEYSRLSRDIGLLTQMMKQIKDSFISTLERADDCYFRKGDIYNKDTKELNRPIAAFSAIYENILTKDHQEKLLEYNGIINEAMLSLIDRCKEIQVDKLSYDSVICPFCHKKSVNKSFDGRSLIAKCPSCGKHFHLNQEHWNYTIEQGRRKRELEEKRRSILSQGCSEGRKAGYKTGFAEGKKVAVREFVDSLPSFFRWLVKLYIK